MPLSDALKNLADAIRSKALISNKLSIIEMTDYVKELTLDIPATKNMLTAPYDFSSGWNGVHNVSYEEGNHYVWMKPSDDIAYQTVNSASPSVSYVWEFYARADNPGDKIHTELFHGDGYKDFVLTGNWRRYISTGKFVFNENKNVYFGPVASNKGNVSFTLPVFTELKLGGS